MEFMHASDNRALCLLPLAAPDLAAPSERLHEVHLNTAELSPHVMHGRCALVLHLPGDMPPMSVSSCRWVAPAHGAHAVWFVLRCCA